MRATLLVLLLAGAAVCQAQSNNDTASAGGTVIIGAAPSGPPSQLELDSTWNASQYGASMHRYLRTFLVGERVLLNNVTYSDTECAELCMDYPGDAEEHYCGIWAWCNDQNGCTVTGGACGTSAMVAYGTCILSTWETVDVGTNSPNGDFGGPNAENGTAMLGLSGPTVGFISGYYISDRTAPTFQAPAGEGWWTKFTAEKGVYYNLDTMDTPTAAGSAQECAERCAATDGCDAYGFCPKEAPNGCLVPKFACNTMISVTAGYCVLGSTESGGGNVPFLKLDAINLDFVGGIRIPAAANATAA